MLTALDMFSIGIGPSSSHTVGPMRIGNRFATQLDTQHLLDKIHTLKVHIYGSLALTGEGHGTFLAVLHGLEGRLPQSIPPEIVHPRFEEIKRRGALKLRSKKSIAFNYDKDLNIHKDKFLPEHPNGIECMAFDASGNLLLQETYFSIGGGFIATKAEFLAQQNAPQKIDRTPAEKSLPYPFKTASELFSLCEKHNMRVAEVAFQNELAKKDEASVRAEALLIIDTMLASIESGLHAKGTLPGRLHVSRRAPALYEKFIAERTSEYPPPSLLAMIYAMAVNEENACFSRVVTSPTNGSAGTIPGVLRYWQENHKDVSEQARIDFLLTAGTIGVLYKQGSSISAAEVGCQGEIGVACSMAAAASTEALGGSLVQIEKAAEIAMEHSLGMTCDPIDGLVQIPCIERNGVAATRAIDITRLSLMEESPGKISLDSVIATMLATGKDMNKKYKETSLGGLAVNQINC